VECFVPSERPSRCDEETEEVADVDGEDELDASNQLQGLEDDPEGEHRSLLRRRAGMFLFYRFKFLIHVVDIINKC
jgi:hypothetical protein